MTRAVFAMAAIVLANFTCSVERRHRPALPHEAVGALLRMCESARHAPDPPLQSEWERALREAEETLAATR